MRLLCVAFLWLAVVSCSDNTKVPADIIQPLKMKKVFWDMVQADRFASSFLIREKDTAKRTRETFELYEKVFRLNDISRDDFRKSYIFYMGRPDLTKMMFDSISTQGERKKMELQKATILKDSLERLLKRGAAGSMDSLGLHGKDSLKQKSLDSLRIRRRDSMILFKKDPAAFGRRNVKYMKSDSAASARRLDSLVRMKKESFDARMKGSTPAMQDSIRQLREKSIKLLK